MCGTPDQETVTPRGTRQPRSFHYQACTFRTYFNMHFQMIGTDTHQEWHCSQDAKLQTCPLDLTQVQSRSPKYYDDSRNMYFLVGWQYPEPIEFC